VQCGPECIGSAHVTARDGTDGSGARSPS
jgi:hypothetical protein